ncbi:MAG: hypothetical protein HYT15_01715 [Candidatus Magasanikbacteria bacterium]|nr:hypothetical protein [Candidatus Magasanikbacteria bacterium]
METSQPIDQTKKFSVPARRSGQNLVAPYAGAYIRFGDALYRVNPFTREVHNLTGSDDADQILDKDGCHWMPGIPRWARRLLRLRASIVARPNPIKRQMIPIITDVSGITPISPPATKTVSREPAKVLWQNVGGRLIVLVFLEDNNPQKTNVFHVNNTDNKVIRKDGSSAQLRTMEELLARKWQKGNLGEARFAPIHSFLVGEAAADFLVSEACLSA